MGVPCRIDSISMPESFLIELGLEESISCFKAEGGCFGDLVECCGVGDEKGRQERAILIGLGGLRK